MIPPEAQSARHILKAASYVGPVQETADDLARWQDLLDRSFDSAGAHLAGMFDDDHRLDAASLAARLTGIFEMHLAVVTKDGRPLVAPVDGLFFRGNVWFGLPATSARSPIVRRHPEVSASFADESFLLMVHGTAQAVDESSALGAEYSAYVKDCYVAQYGEVWLAWHEHLKSATPPGEGFTGWIEPRKIFAKA